MTKLTHMCLSILILRNQDGLFGNVKQRTKHEIVYLSELTEIMKDFSISGAMISIIPSIYLSQCHENPMTSGYKDKNVKNKKMDFCYTNLKVNFSKSIFQNIQEQIKILFQNLHSIQTGDFDRLQLTRQKNRTKINSAPTVKCYNEKGNIFQGPPNYSVVVRSNNI